MNGQMCQNVLSTSVWDRCRRDLPVVERAQHSAAAHRPLAVLNLTYLVNIMNLFNKGCCITYTQQLHHLQQHYLAALLYLNDEQIRPSTWKPTSFHHIRHQINRTKTEMFSPNNILIISVPQKCIVLFYKLLKN